MNKAVIDQPGLKLTLIGLIMSLFLGLTVRSQIKPSRIQQQVTTYFAAIEQANNSKKMKIDFDEARLELSEWGLPLPLISISGIRVGFDDNQCEENQVHIEKVQIPIRWSWLFERTHIHPQLRFGLVEVRLNQLKSCVRDLTPKKKEVAEQNATLPMNETIKTSEQEIFIDRLRIIDRSQYAYAAHLQSVKLKIRYNRNKAESVELKSQLYMMKENVKGFYRIKSDLNIFYSHLNKSESFLKLNGKIINRDFGLFVKYNEQKNELSGELSMQEVGIKILLETLLQNDQFKEALSVDFKSHYLTPFSVTLNADLKYDIDSQQISQVQVPEFKLFSYDSELIAKNISFLNLNPLKIQSIEMDIKKLNLDEILQPFVRPKSISKFGYLNGHLIVNDQGLYADGTVHNSEINFSHKGRSVQQTLTTSHFKLRPVDADVYRLSLFDSFTDKNKHQGVADVFIDDHGQIQSLHADFSAFYLNPQIIDLYLNTEPQGEWPVRFVFKKSNLVEQAEASIDKLKSDQFDIDKLVLNYRHQTDVGSRNDQIHFYLNFSKAKIDSELFDNGELDLLKKISPDVDSYNLKNGSFIYSKNKNERIEGYFENMNPDSKIVFKSEGYDSYDKTKIKIKAELLKNRVPLNKYNILFDAHSGLYQFDN